MTYLEILAALSALSFAVMYLSDWIASIFEKPATGPELAKLEELRRQHAEEIQQKLDNLNAGLDLLSKAGSESSEKVAKIREEMEAIKREDIAYKDKIANASEEELKGELKKHGYEEKDFE